MTASIAQEYYKLHEEWRKIDVLPSWKLAVWVADYPDVDIITKFMDIEQSPVGKFNDLFFRFDTVYEGDTAAFEEKLWAEFISWFDPSPDPKMDLHRALYENHFLTELFAPKADLPHTVENLWSELLRFRQSINGITPDTHFCLYFPIVAYSKHNIAEWLRQVIGNIPDGLRLVTLDLAADRKIRINESDLCIYLHPKLNMAEAISNEMKKGGGDNDTVDIDARFRKQIIAVMDSTTEKLNNKTPHEVKKLLSITEEIGTTSSRISGLLIAAQAHFAIRDTRKSTAYTDEALDKAAEAMGNNEPSGYQVWKSCMLLKGALLYNESKYTEALLVYEDLATKASEQADAYYLMEARRLSGHLYYEKGEKQTAFEYMLLALASGAYLDISVRRQSTFLHAAHMALFLCTAIRPSSDVAILQDQLTEWLGKDWAKVLQEAGVNNDKTASKGMFSPKIQESLN